MNIAKAVMIICGAAVLGYEGARSDDPVIVAQVHQQIQAQHDAQDAVVRGMQQWSGLDKAGQCKLLTDGENDYLAKVGIWNMSPTRLSGWDNAKSDRGC